MRCLEINLEGPTEISDMSRRRDIAALSLSRSPIQRTRKVDALYLGPQLPALGTDITEFVSPRVARGSQRGEWTRIAEKTWTLRAGVKVLKVRASCSVLLANRAIFNDIHHHQAREKTAYASRRPARHSVWSISLHT